MSGSTAAQSIEIFVSREIIRYSSWGVDTGAPELRRKTEAVARAPRRLRRKPVVVLAELERLLSSEVRLPERSPFGDGKAAVRIADVVASRLEL